MKVQRSLLSLLFAASFTALPGARAAMYSLNPDASDARVFNPNNGGAVTIIDQGNYAARIGEQNDPGGSCYVFAFQLPTFTGGDNAFTAAGLRMQLFQFANGNNNIGNVDFYGLGVRTSPTPLTTDYYQGTADANNTLIQQGFLTPTSPVRTDANNGPFINLSTQGAASLVNYLNAVDLNGANAGRWVIFRLSYTVNPIPNGDDAYTVLTQDAGGDKEKPLLTLTTGSAAVPEPSTYCLLAVGGLGLLVFCRRARA